MSCTTNVRRSGRARIARIHQLAGGVHGHF
jgi:hypothetical protein